MSNFQLKYRGKNWEWGVDYALEADKGVITVLNPICKVPWQKKRFNSKKSLENYRRRNKGHRFTLTYTYLD